MASILTNLSNRISRHNSFRRKSETDTIENIGALYLQIYNAIKYLEDQQSQIKTELLTAGVSPLAFPASNQQLTIAPGRGTSTYNMNNIMTEAAIRNVIPALTPCLSIIQNRITDPIVNEIVTRHTTLVPGSQTIKVTKLS